METVPSDRLLSTKEVADYLGVPLATLYAWRSKGEGPRGYRVGKHVRFSRESVEAWLEDQADERTPDAAA